MSVGYAPIEQSRVGGLGMFSPETDIYSLGATMFKMLTGQTPPEATAVFDEGLPELQMGISEQTKRVIEKAMQPRRKERYHTIVDFLDALGTENAQAVHVKTRRFNLKRLYICQLQLKKILSHKRLNVCKKGVIQTARCSKTQILERRR